MASLLIDANLDGHAEVLDSRLRSDTWRDVRDHLDIQFLHFEQAGLDRAAKDDVVWRLCQRQGYYLLTANRNRKSEDSLEAIIRREGTPQSLPVFTLANADRIYQSAAYLDEVVESLLDYLLDESNYHGTGRLYLP
ncbi:MAG TPA: hypothetical protein VNX28_15625 [Gemmataceae bacterium]|nr:hypothetical protein [Gemmataceae bacterium]